MIFVLLQRAIQKTFKSIITLIISHIYQAGAGIFPGQTGSGTLGRGGPAPAPPRRDPRTTLSVGRARAKSMVAGLGTKKTEDLVT